MSDELLIPANDERAAKVIAALNGWNENLKAKDRESKYEKMAISPFIFYRGSNHLFWADFAGDERLERFGNETTRTWLQGDLHTDNFGAFGNDENEIVYNINDFDESVIADYQFDLWRMAVSIILVAQEQEDLSRDEQADVVDAFGQAYLKKLIGFIKKPKEQDIVFGVDNTHERLAEFLQDLEEENSRGAMLDKWSVVKSGERCFDIDGSKGKLERIEDDAAKTAIVEAMKEYDNNLVKKPEDHHAGYFMVKDVVRRLSAGTGSLGTPRYYVLIEGAEGSPDDDRILDVKRQSLPTAYQFLGEGDQVEYLIITKSDPGQDAVWHEAGYRALSRYTDDHLGWLELSGEFYSVRERSFFKEVFPTKKLKNEKRFKAMAEQWGKILATDHSRSLPSFDEEYFTGKGLPAKFFFLKEQVEELTDGKKEEFLSLLREIAFEYAEQVTADWQTFTDTLENTAVSG